MLRYVHVKTINQIGGIGKELSTMMKSEFIEKVEFEPTAEEYADIEAEYMGTDIDKDQFCKEWKKNGGIQRLMRLRARRIEELENELTVMKKNHEEYDTRQCQNFNETVKRWQDKDKNLKYQLEKSHEVNDNLEKLLEEAKAGKKEAENKLETVKAAFIILGIGKEVA